jgi:signal transduction histidine kinase
VEIAAYRVIQEALTNVAKHAAATSCRVSVACIAGELRITIEDDGKGFDTARRERAGLGLIGIRERVSQLDGRLAIESAPGNGTRVSVALPAVSARATALPPDGEVAALARTDSPAEALG